MSRVTTSPPPAGRTTPTRLAVGVLALLTVGLLGGCGKVSYDPEPVDWSQQTDKATRASGQGPDETPTPASSSPEPTETPIDVCALASAEDVQQIFGRDEAPEVDEPDGTAAGAPDLPGVSSAYRCVYRWSPGQTADLVSVTLLPETGLSDPAELVTKVVGSDYEQVDGAGDAAAIDRSGSAGHGTAFLIAGTSTESGVAGVFVLGPKDTEAKAFTTFATRILEQAAGAE